MKKILFSMIVTMMLVSCNNSLQKEQDQYVSLKEQAIKVHDEVMPKMGELMSLKAQLKKEKDSTSSLVMERIEALDAAHEGMMVWMRDYSEKFPYGAPLPETKEELDTKLPVLEKEVEEIKALKAETNMAIKRANSVLEGTNL